MTAAPTIAFVTMVRDDHFFLRLWVEHYARHVPRHHLFILFDGFDQTPPPFTAGCQIITLPRSTPGPGWDTRRWTMLADFNATLLGRFDVVVLNDVDEIIVADPASGISLLDALARAQDVGVISPFAVEVVHRFDLCPAPLDPNLPILRQRPHVRIREIFSKPCISAVPLRWNTGGHRSNYPKLTLDPVLYLFHLQFIDRDMLLQRQASRNAIMHGSQPGRPVAGATWAEPPTTLDAVLLSLQEEGVPYETDFRFERQRGRMASGWLKNESTGFWKLGKIHSTRTTYRIPDRFHDLI
jgi:hypothetical protein